MGACEHCKTCPCKIYQGYKQPLEVPDHRDIMIIGDSVTPLETMHNTHMTGTAIKLLFQAMEQVGLPTSEDKVYLANAVMCAVPKKKGKAFPKEPLIECRGRLLKEIQKVKPKIILTLGKASYQGLTGDFNVKITAKYGAIEHFDYCGDAIVIPVMHPALIMRAPNDYKVFLTELHLVKQLYGGSGSNDTGITEWQILKTEQECLQAVEFLKQFPRVAADLETTSLDYREAEFCVLGICFQKNKVFVLPREMQHMAKKFFALDNLRWTWHHGKYDRKVMWRRGLTDYNVEGEHIFPHQNDTIYMHYVLDETSAHDLGYLTKTFLQAEEYKYKMNQEFKNVTHDTYEQYFDALCERVAVDADYTFQLEEALEKEMNKPGNESLVKVYNMVIMPAARFLAQVEQNGMLVDPTILEEMGIKYKKLLADIQSEIEEAAAPYWDKERYMQETGAKSASDKFKPSSPKQMSWMIFDRLKLKPRRRKGRSTDADVLKSIDEDIPLVKLVLQHRGVNKEYSTYVKGILKKRDIDGRVRSNFSLHITATGRLSSKEPNVQNIPASKGVGNVRRCFVPPKGKILMEVDYSGAELRWMAFLSGDKNLKEIFIQGRNLHKETAKKLFGPDFTPAQKMRAKAINFGIPYGREAKSIADEFAISIEEAEKMMADWYGAYPDCKKYLDWCAEQAVLGNYLQTPWGNRRRPGLVTPDTIAGLQNEFKNFPIQCSSSHTLLYTLIQELDYDEDLRRNIRMFEYLKKKWDVAVVDLIHDSVLLEVPMDKETVTAVSRYVSKKMIETPVKLFNCEVPFKTDTDLGPDWGNVQAFNNETGMMELENEHHEVTEVPYEEWIESVYHYDNYNQPWYVDAVSFQQHPEPFVRDISGEPGC